MTKHALVTGASSGIGFATANKLLSSGYRVSGIARDCSSLTDSPIVGHRIDLADITALPDALAEITLPLDLLVLNAGYGRFGGLEQFSYSQIRHLVDTNLVSNLFLLKHFLPRMKAQGYGDIVLVGSESAVQGGRAGAVYCATKFGLRGLAQSLRVDCAGANIRVILINPGPVDSAFFDDLDFAPQQGEEFAIQPDSVANAIVNALSQPANVVIEEINLQPLKRSFRKKNLAGDSGTPGD